ncbi:hypothetical protein F2P56_015363 [Juglans regia]|uniref:Uncharacterized protein LOC108979865 isoform X2 n=3 Tax=Juglans regia TaxID=51240 RepID=A0A2I4DGB0_JUGRE|nr:uncharacterized protein LOC108979865 isoform X2 [Juglans regia]KAF5465346.1 hypothetical protein F2P56_015363 [Juglans regia]
MANKTNEDSYHKLSRKELQSLCKKYGLPANRSHSGLATLLISYLEEASSIRHGRVILTADLHISKQDDETTLCQRACSSCTSSSSFQIGASWVFEWPRKMRMPTEMSSSQLVVQRDRSDINHRESLRESFDNTRLGFARDGTVENGPGINCRKMNVDACPAENVIVPSMKTSCVPSPSFEFYVMSEEGINLHVDLNSSPSDWTKRLKNEVYISEGVHRDRSRSLHSDLGKFGETDIEMNNSFILNIEPGQINNAHVLTRSSASSGMTENDHLGFKQPDKCDASLLSSAVMPCIDKLKNLKRDQMHVSSEPNFNVHDQIDSAAKSCDKDQCTVILDSNVSVTPQLKTACNSVINPMSGGPLSSLTLKDQTSKPGDEIFENSSLQNSSSLVNPCVMYPGFPAGASMEMPTSEVASCRKDASCSSCENGDSVIKPIFDGPLRHLTLKDQNSKCGDENFENSSLQNSCSLVNPSMVYPGFSTSASMEMPTSEVASCRKDASCSPCENGGSLVLVDLKHKTEKEEGGLANSSELNDDTYRNLSPTSASMEMPTSEVASCRKDASCSPCENGGSLDLVDLEHKTEKEQGGLAGLANSSELNDETYRNLSPTTFEEWDRSNVINGKECSECSQIDNSVERTCLSSNDTKSKEPPKKRKHTDGEDQSSYPKPDAKILRSSKHIARKVLPRRSMRLISKVSLHSLGNVILTGMSKAQGSH